MSGWGSNDLCEGTREERDGVLVRQRGILEQLFGWASPGYGERCSFHLIQTTTFQYTKKASRLPRYHLQEGHLGSKTLDERAVFGRCVAAWVDFIAALGLRDM